MGWVGITYEIGQTLLTEYGPDGFLYAQHDGYGSSARVKSSQVLHPLGFHARPRTTSKDSKGNIKAGGGALLRIGRDGDDYFVELLGDARTVALIPPLAEGSSVQYACSPVPSFDVHDGEDGTKQIYVEIGDSAHLVTIGKDGNGKAIVELVHADGMAITMLERGVVIKNAAGDGYLEVNDSGVNINGNVKVTGALDVGAASFPLAKAAELLTWATNVTTAINELAPGAVVPLVPTVATALTKGS